MTVPPFRAAPGLRNPHVQTLVSRVVRARIEPRFERTRIDTPDGDFLDLDVWAPPEHAVGVCLLLHGLEGCGRSGYMVSTSAALSALGIQAVALNFRSCGGEPNRTATSYHSGRTDDIERALAWVAGSFPALPRAAVGFSLGGNALLNLLGTRGDAGLRAAAAISVPWDLSTCATALDRGLSRMYAHYFMRTLRRKAAEKAARFPALVSPEAASARTIRDFDDMVTAPLHGFRDAEDYYTKCSAARHVGAVTVPTLLIQSADDPLVPGASVPLEVIRRRPNLTLELTPHGGHVGFLDGRLGAGPEGWLEQRITKFVGGALVERGFRSPQTAFAEPAV